ncbi:MAG: LysR substrate-binding domain-containing protein [Pseudomonadota bacterium]
MDLRDLEVFRAVVSEGGITRASEKLGRVQSSITARIKQLEQELGVDLFLREGKKMLISPDGRVLLGYAERLLALAAEAKAALRDDVPRGEFSLGAMESTAAVRLPSPLTRFYQRYPEVDLKLRTGNPRQLSTAVMAGELEAALIAEPIAEARFDSALAFEESLVLIAPRDYPRIDDQSPSPDTIIVFENGCPHRRQLEAWYQARDDIPSKTIELGSYHAMFGSVVAGMGIALMPESVLAAFPERDKVSAHPLPEGQNKLRTYLIWRRGVRSPKIQALMNVLN